MLMVWCWCCHIPTTFDRIQELKLLYSDVFICGSCECENAVTSELKEDIRKDWMIK